MTQPLISDAYIAKHLRDEYSPDEMQAIHRNADAIYEELKKGKTPRTHPDSGGELLQILGPHGAGKSSFMAAIPPEAIEHSIVIDNDIIRKRMQLYQDTLQQHFESRSDLLASGVLKKADLRLESDQIAHNKWNEGAAHIARLIYNRAQSDGFDIVRTGKINGHLTHQICSRAEFSGYRVTTLAIVAPQDVCVASATLRQLAEGHPTNEKFLAESFKLMPIALPFVASKSDHLKIFWRPQVDSAPMLVAEKEKSGPLTEHDPAGLMALISAVSKKPYSLLNVLRTGRQIGA